MRASVFFLVALVLSLPAASPAGLQHLDSFHNLQLKGPALGPDHSVYGSGRLRLNLAGGSTFPVLAGGRVVGLFFTGKGDFQYLSEDPFAEVNFQRNVKDRTRSAVVDNRVADTMTSALIIDAAIAEKIPGVDVPYDAPGEDFQKALTKHVKAFSKDENAPCYHLAVQALLEERPGDAACVQISGKDDYVHVRDEIRDKEEHLSAMDLTSNPFLSGHRFPRTLSRQMIDLPPMARRPVRWLLRAVDIELVNPHDLAMDLTVRETVEVVEPLRTLAFTLDNLRFGGEAFLPIDIDSITDPAGTALPFSREGPDIVVELPRLYQKGESLGLSFELSGNVLYRPGSHNFWWLSIGYWLPLPDRWDQANFTFHSVVKVAAPFVPFSMGRVVRRWQEDGLEAAEFEITKPVQFAVVLAGKYNIYSETRDGLTIHLASYAFKRNDSMKRIAHNTFELIKFYEPLLGKYPFAELSILEINAYGFGQAPPGVIYLTHEAFDPGPEGRRYRAELNHRMAHEVAHQWWGHVAQMADPREQWLSEATAEYYSALAIRRLLGEGKYEAAIRSWKEGAGKLKGLGSIYYANRMTDELAALERYGLLYAQAPLKLKELHEALGDETFLTIFKSLLSSFPYQPVDSDTFIRLTNHITKEDWRPWFEKEFMTVPSK